MRAGWVRGHREHLSAKLTTTQGGGGRTGVVLDGIGAGAPSKRSPALDARANSVLIGRERSPVPRAPPGGGGRSPAVEGCFSSAFYRAGLHSSDEASPVVNLGMYQIVGGDVEAYNFTDEIPGRLIDPGYRRIPGKAEVVG